MTATEAHQLLAAAAMILFGSADWIAGRAIPLPGRAVWYGAAGLTLALGLFWPPLAVLGLSWGLWRGVLGWKTFGGKLDVHTGRQFAGMIARNLASAVFPVAALIWIRWGQPWWPPVAAMSVFSLYAALVNVWFGYEVTKGRDVDPAVDALHGAGFGLAAVWALLAA